jgi:hypothetical protein
MTLARPPDNVPEEEKVEWKLLLEHLKRQLRVEHYAYATEQTYIHGIKKYLEFYNWKKPSLLAEPDIQYYLEYLAIQDQVAVASQNENHETVQCNARPYLTPCSKTIISSPSCFLLDTYPSA